MSYVEIKVLKCDWPVTWNSQRIKLRDPNLIGKSYDETYDVFVATLTSLPACWVSTGLGAEAEESKHKIKFNDEFWFLNCIKVFNK